MSDPAGRPRQGGGRSSTIRRGFEVYAPKSGPTATARRAADVVSDAEKTGGGGGHDTTRGRALWEDETEAPRLPKGEKEWKHDRWNEDNDYGGDSSAAVTGGRRRARGDGAAAARRRGVGGSGGAAANSLDADVPSEERYEDMARKVEEEVVAKLARAQMMGMMLRAHREQEQAAEKRRGGGGGGGGGRRGDGSGSNRRSRAATGGRADQAAGSRQVLQRPRDAAATASCVGSRQRPVLAPRAPVEGTASTEASAADGSVPGAVVGKDVRVGAPGHERLGAGPGPGRGARQQAGLLKVSPEELSRERGIPALKTLAEDPADADPDSMSVEDAYAVVGAVERQHKALLDDLRRDIGLVAVGGGSSGGGGVGRRPATPAVAQASSPSSVPAAVAVAAAKVKAAASRGGGGVADDSLELSSPALYERISRVRAALSRALGSLVRRDPAFSLRKRLPNRLWMAHYRELEVVQQRLRQLLPQTTGGGANGGGGITAHHQQKRHKQKLQQQQQQQEQQKQKQKQHQALRARLFTLIQEAEADIGAMVETVERQVAAAAAAAAAAAEDPKGRSGGLSEAVAATSGTGGGGDDDDDGEVDSRVGDLAGSVDDDDDDEGDEGMTLEERGRQHALQVFLTSLGDMSRYRCLHGGGGEDGWARAQDLYLRALRIDPSSGKVWNQMAVLASSRQDNLEAFYAYLRGLCAAAPHPAGRESLLVLHERCKARLSTLREATALDALSGDEHQARFRLYLLGACGTCLSRVDLGTFDGYLALSERHMVSCVQLYLMKGAEAGGGGGGGVVDSGGERGLEGTLARAIVMCVCTVSASMEAWRSRGMEGGGSWTEDAATSRAVRLCLHLAGALAGLHRKTSRRGWERVTAAGVGVFLDWFACRPQFGEGARGTATGLVEEFQHAMACVVEFANGIVRSSSSSSRGRGGGDKSEPESEVDPDAALWEDEECRGLPAFATVAERRAAKARRKARAAARRNTQVGGDADGGGATAAGSPRSKSWADDDASGNGSGGGGGGGSSEGRSPPNISPPPSAGAQAIAVAGAEPWKIRVARLRRQVEFCVERGWIARGNRPGTYTLPKPPPRHGSSSTSTTLPEEQQGELSPAAADGGAGFSIDAAPPTRRGRGAAGQMGTLWVEDDVGGGGGGGGGGRNSNLGRPSARQPRIPLIPPGQQRDYLSNTAAAAETAGEQARGGVTPPKSLSPRFSGTRSGAGAAQKPASSPAEISPVTAPMPTPMPTPTPTEQQQPVHGRGDAAAEDANAVAMTLSSLRLEPPPPYPRAAEAAATGTAAAYDAANPGAAAAGAGLRKPPGIGVGLSQEAINGGVPYAPYHRVDEANNDSTVPVGAGFGFGGIGDGVVSSGDREAAAVAAAAAGEAGMAGGSGGGEPLPESVFGVLLAGLESADEDGHHRRLCQYCCATIDPTTPACGVCGAPAELAATVTALPAAVVPASGVKDSDVAGPPSASSSAAAAAAAEAIPECRWRTYLMAADGRPYYSDGETSVWVKPKELQEYEAAVSAAAAAAAAAAPPTTAVTGAPFTPAVTGMHGGEGGGGGGDGEGQEQGRGDKDGEEGEGPGVPSAAAEIGMSTAGTAAGTGLPAGVLAVGDLAEVIAKSKPGPPAAAAAAAAAAAGAQQRGGGGRARNSGRNAHNPAVIARAGLGDGGVKSGGGTTAMFGWPRGAPRSELPLVVIDVPNVAMRHGLNKRFSCKGVQMAIEYFRTAGHRVLGFLPDYYLDLERTNGLERAKKLGVAEVRASRLPDDVQLLQRLVEDGLIVATPPQDYDDSYCIKYAMAREGYVVTNDLYRDHVKSIDGRKKADAARRWIKTHSISYTFVGDEFFPNPDFSFLQQDQSGGGGGGAP